MKPTVVTEALSTLSLVTHHVISIVISPWWGALCMASNYCPVCRVVLAHWGFMKKPEERTPIKAVRVAADLPEAERSKLEVFRTDTTSFKALIEAQRNRGGDWYKFAANHIELCNVPIPVRVIK